MPFSPIQDGKHHIQYSDIPGETMRAAGLKPGEVAINTADAKMFMRAEGGNLLTFDGMVYPDRNATDLTIASAYATNLLHPLVSSVTPVVEQTAVDGTDGASITTSLRSYAMSETIVGLSRTLSGGERTIALFDITTETIVREVVVAPSGTLGFTYDPWNKLLVGRVANLPTKALDVNGNEYTFPASPLNASSGPSGKGLINCGFTQLAYKTGEALEGYWLGIRWPDGGGYMVGNEIIEYVNSNGKVVSSKLWTEMGNASFQEGNSINGDFTKILTRTEWPIDPVGAMLDPATGDSTMATANPEQRQCFPSLKDAGVGEVNASGIRYFDASGVAGGYTAFTGDSLSAPYLQCVLPDGRLLVRNGTTGQSGLAFVTIYSGVPDHAKELILSPLFQ